MFRTLFPPVRRRALRIPRGAFSSSSSYSQHAALPLDRDEAYWQKIPRWKDVSVPQFLSHQWQMSHTVQSEPDLCAFLASVLPRTPLPPPTGLSPARQLHSTADTPIPTAAAFIERVRAGIQRAPMAVRLSPHILSVIDWRDPLNDPVRRQFIPLSSPWNIDHPMAVLDPLQENQYSPVPGLIHRYPDKALFMATSICPVYCRFCFRSYAVGAETDSVKKQRFLPLVKKWQPRLDYIAATPTLKDIVISGGDTYLLDPPQLTYLGDALLAIPHIRRFRFATKGLSVSPSRLLDPDDGWVDAVVALERKARRMGKHVCIHTHFNSVQEISWITRRGAQRLYEAGVTVRNQTVLLNGVNNTPERMCALVQTLGDMNIQPYYVYQGDIVPGAEDLRTPMSDSLDLERVVRGSTAGFLIPNFVLDVPGEGGKRLTRSVEKYDRRLGVSTLTAPGRDGRDVEVLYWDPLWSVSAEAREEILSGKAIKGMGRYGITFREQGVVRGS